MPDFQAPGPESKIQNPKSEIVCPQSPGLESKIQNPKPKITSSLTPDPGPRIPDKWLAFAITAGIGTVAFVLLVLFEKLAWWKVLVYAWLPTVVIVFLFTLFLKRRIAPFRIAQILSAVIINGYIVSYIQKEIIYSGFLKSVPQFILNCYGGPLAVYACPIGSTQQMVGMKSIPWLALGVFIVAGAFVGRAACAWTCPFGMWQDLLYKTGFKGQGAKGAKKRWVTFAVIALVTAVVAALAAFVVKGQWLKFFGFGWLPFNAAVLYVTIRGKFDIPQRLWLGGFAASLGLAVLVWTKLGPSFGVVTAAVGMMLLGLSGRWFAAAVAAIAAFLIAFFAKAAIGPLSGPVLGVVLAAVGFGLVLVLDVLAKVSLPSTFLKYGYLFLVAGVASFLTIEPWFCKLCPQGTLGAGIPLVLWDPVNALRGLVGWLYWVKISILLLVIVGAMAIKRPFCRLVCPIGAVYSVFNKGSLLKLTLDREQCKDCGLCRKVCPMNIEPTCGQNQLECIRCGECVTACPKSCLRFRV